MAQLLRRPLKELEELFRVRLEPAQNLRVPVDPQLKLLEPLLLRGEVSVRGIYRELCRVQLLIDLGHLQLYSTPLLRLPVDRLPQNPLSRGDLLKPEDQVSSPLVKLRKLGGEAADSRAARAHLLLFRAHDLLQGRNRLVPQTP